MRSIFDLTIPTSVFYSFSWHEAFSIFLGIIGFFHFLSVRRIMKEYPPRLTEWGLKGRKAGILFKLILFLISCAFLPKGSIIAQLFVSYYLLFVACKFAKEFSFGFAKEFPGKCDPADKKFKRSMRISGVIAFIFTYTPLLLLVWQV